MKMKKIYVMCELVLEGLVVLNVSRVHPILVKSLCSVVVLAIFVDAPSMYCNILLYVFLCFKNVPYLTTSSCAPKMCLLILRFYLIYLAKTK